MPLSSAGKVVIVIYLSWALFLLCAEGRLYAERMLSAGYRSAAPWVFLLVLLGVVLWVGTAQIGRLCPCGGDLLPGPSADPGAGTAFFHPRYEPRACAAGLDNGRSGRNSGHAGAGWRTELRGVRRIFRGERHQAFW